MDPIDRTFEKLRRVPAIEAYSIVFGTIRGIDEMIKHLESLGWTMDELATEFRKETPTKIKRI